MAWDFKPGDRVVYIGGSTHWRRTKGFMGLFRRIVPGTTDLVRGEIYTVVEAFVGTSRLTGEIALGINLAERPVTRGEAYPASRFRPVRPTSIAALQAHLVSLPVTPKVGA